MDETHCTEEKVKYIREKKEQLRFSRTVILICVVIAGATLYLFSSQDAESLLSPNYDQRPPHTEVDTVVLHSTEIDDIKKVIKIFRNPKSGVSAHYTVDKDGTVVQHVREKYRAWHAGESMLPNGRTRVNDFSIGIELVNKNTGNDPYPSSQIDSLTKLLLDIESRHPIEYLVSHAEVAQPPGRKSDPKGFDYAQLGDIEVRLRGKNNK